MKYFIAVFLNTILCVSLSAQYASLENPDEAIKIEPTETAIGLYASGTFSDCPIDATVGISNCTIDALVDYLSATIKFPEIAMDYDLTASCHVKFTIDTSGQSTGVHVHGCASSIYEKPIQQAISAIEWTPVEKNGDKISYGVEVDVRFQ